MTVTLVQNAPRLSRRSLESVLELIDLYGSDTDVLVFPELVLNGYLLQDKLFEDAWEPEELQVIKDRSAECDIVLGAAIREKGRTYNSALYFSQGALLHRHDKVHLPNYGMFEEARYFFRGERIEAFETMLGRCVMLVCEDLWRAEVIACVSAQQPDVVFVIANSPSRDFSDRGLLIEAQWDALLKSLALLGSTYVLFVNRVGFEDGLGFWGGSRAVTSKGEVQLSLPLFEPAHARVMLDRRLHAQQKWLAKLD